MGFSPSKYWQSPCFRETVVQREEICAPELISLALKTPLCSWSLSPKWRLRLFSKGSWAMRMCLDNFHSGNEKRSLGMRKGYWKWQKDIEQMLWFRTRFQHHTHTDNRDWLVGEGGVGVILCGISIYFKQMSMPCSKLFQHKSSHEEYQKFAEDWTVPSFASPGFLTSLSESQLQLSCDLFKAGTEFY